jgi:hypothetical protein
LVERLSLSIAALSTIKLGKVADRLAKFRMVRTVSVLVDDNGALV